MSILAAWIIAILLYVSGMAARANPILVAVVQLLWLLATLAMVTHLYIWLRRLHQSFQGDSKVYPGHIKELAWLFNDLREIKKKLAAEEQERWSHTAKQAGNSLAHVINSTIDALTGVANRRMLESRLNETETKENLLSIIMTDIDHFKKVNDTYGHKIGDEVLIHFARVAQKAIRGEDFLSRYGGEEFTVICNGNLEQASVIAERIRQALEVTPAVTTAGEIKITASFGVSQRRTGEKTNEVIRRADEAMYRAKETGRNKVIREDVSC